MNDKPPGKAIKKAARRISKDLVRELEVEVARLKAELVERCKHEADAVTVVREKIREKIRLLETENARLKAQAHADEVEWDKLKKELHRYEQWVHDCQAGMYINCVYCGHRYGPDNEIKATMQQVLYDHIAQCPKHPMSAMRNLLEIAWGIIANAGGGNWDLETTEWREAAIRWRDRYHGGPPG